MSTKTVTAIANDRIFEEKTTYHFSDGGFSHLFTGRDENGCFFSVEFTDMTTFVCLHDSGNKNLLTFILAPSNPKFALDVAKILYIACANALFFSGRKTNKFIELLVANLGTERLERVSHYSNVKRVGTTLYNRD